MPSKTVQRISSIHSFIHSFLVIWIGKQPRFFKPVGMCLLLVDFSIFSSEVGCDVKFAVVRFWQSHASWQRVSINTVPS